MLSFPVPPPPRGLRLSALEKLADRLPDSPSALTGPRLVLDSADLYSAAAAAVRGPDALRPAGPRLDLCTCNKDMEAMLDAGRPDGAISLFNSLIDSGIVPDVGSFISLVNAYLMDGRRDDARGAFYLMFSFRHAELVNELISLGRIADAIEVPRMMAEWPHFAAGSVLHNVIVQGGVDIDRVAELFDELKRRYTVCDRIMHLSIARYRWSITAAYMHIDPPSWSLGRMLGQLFWASWYKRKREMAMECYCAMLDWGFYQSMLDPTTLNALLRDLLEHSDNRIAVANRLFDKMLESHNPPSLVTVNAETCNMMVNQRFKEGKVEEAVEIFRRIWEKEKAIDVGCLDNLVGKLRENGRASDAKKLYDEMPMVSVRACDYGSMIAHSFRNGKWEDASDYFGKMLHAHEGFDLRLYTKMAYGLVKAGCFQEAMDVLMMAYTDVREMNEKGLDLASSSFGLGEAARHAIEVFYPQH